MFTPDPNPLEIEVLVIPDATLILVAAVIEPLRAANRVLGRAQFRWIITTPDGAPAPTRFGGLGAFELVVDLEGGLAH